MATTPFVVYSMCSLALTVLGAAVGFAQNYPNKPVRIVVAGVGGSTDFTARMIAQSISEGLGQPVVVENRNGMLADLAVAKAAPDGYVIGVQSGGLWLTPLLEKVPYDAVKDFAPITLAFTAPSVLVVHSSFPVRTVKELIALARAKPGELNYASSISGGGSHLATELFKSIASVNIVRVPYKGSGQAIQAVVAGQVPMMFADASTAMPLVKSGHLRAIAVTSAKPSRVVPDLPTVAESVPGYETVGIVGLVAPAGTPGAIIQRLNREIVSYLKSPEGTEKFLHAGTEIVGSSPEEFGARIKAEIARWSKVINDAGIKAEKD